MFKAFLSLEDLLSSGKKRVVKYESEEVAAEDFACAHGYHEERNRAFKLIYIREDEGNDDCICKYGRKGSKHHAYLTGFEYDIVSLFGMGKKIGSHSADQGCKRSEDYIEVMASGKDVTDDASDSESGDCCGSECCKDCKSF